MWAAGGLGRQVPADAAASQLGEASPSTFPMLPGDGAQPSSGPLVKFAQHRRGLAEAEVTAPADKVSGQLLGDLREAFSARAPRQLPNFRLKAGDRLRRDAPSRLVPACEAEAQELADARFGDRALRFVDLQLEALFEEPFNAGHHPFARPLAAHIDVASSSGEESHPSALTEPDVTLSRRPALTLRPPVSRHAPTGQITWGPAARCAPASASTRVLGA